MKTETFEFVGHKGTNLPTYLWLPEGEVKAVLQVTHGMTEHMGRYEAFAEFCARWVSLWRALICAVMAKIPATQR